MDKSIEEVLRLLGKDKPIYIVMEPIQYELLSKLLNFPEGAFQDKDNPIQFRWTNKPVGKLMEMIL